MRSGLGRRRGETRRGARARRGEAKGERGEARRERLA